MNVKLVLVCSWR